MFSGVHGRMRERVGKWRRDACLREDGSDKAVWFFTVVFVYLKKKQKKLCHPTDSCRAITKLPQLMDDYVY